MNSQCTSLSRPWALSVLIGVPAGMHEYTHFHIFVIRFHMSIFVLLPLRKRGVLIVLGYLPVFYHIICTCLCVVVVVDMYLYVQTTIIVTSKAARDIN